MAEYKFPSAQSGSDANKMMIHGGDIRLPSGKRIGSESLFFDIMSSGVYCERYTSAKHNVKTHILVSKPVHDAIKNWVLASDIDDGQLTGYAQMPLCQYLAKMFPENDDVS